MYRFIDLFAGIGGTRMAFESTGGVCVYTAEWDKFARQTYAANFSVNHPFVWDVTQIDTSTIPEYDVLLGGFPCQPFSKAGQELGFKDVTRGTLFYDIARILEDTRPRMFLLENVPGLIRNDQGRTLQTVVDVLSGLGYNVTYEVLRSEYHVPQARDRLYIVGHRDHKFTFAGIHWFCMPLQRPYLGQILEHNVDDKYTLSDSMWQCLLDHRQTQKEKGNNFGYGLNTEHSTTRTLLARYYKDGSEILLAQEGKNPRRLTPRECARLMGFPDSFEIPVSNTQAYKQFGNSVVVPVVTDIAWHMYRQL